MSQPTPVGAIVTVPDSDTVLEVLEAEIIETESETLSEQSALSLETNWTQDSQNSSEVLATWLLLEGSATLVPDYLSRLKTGLDLLLTPCRLSTLGVLLLANLLLTWNQLSTPKNGVQATAELPPPLSQSPALSPSLNFAAAKPELALNSLSTAAAAPAKIAKTSLPPTPPLGAAAPAPSLSSALLPYFPAQPPQSIPPAPVAQVPAAAAPTTPTAQYLPLPALPSLQQPPALPAPPPPSPEDIQKQLIIRQDLDRLRLESENPPPLGFNHEYRVKVQSAQTQSDPNQLREQLQQLQQQAIPTKLE